MSVGSRLKEERIRLGFNQTDFAGKAGASKGALINWEKDVASPNALALIGFAEAGADALYILTGRRTGSGPDLSPTTVSDDIARARAVLLDPTRFALPGESLEATEERARHEQIEVLGLIAAYKGSIGSLEQQQEVSDLLAIATDPQKLTAFRAADHAQLRGKRKRIKQHFTSYLEMNDQHPSEAAINIMVGIALDYGVPISPLVELVLELVGGYEHDS